MKNRRPAYGGRSSQVRYVVGLRPASLSMRSDRRPWQAHKYTCMQNQVLPAPNAGDSGGYESRINHSFPAPGRLRSWQGHGDGPLVPPSQTSVAVNSLARPCRPPCGEDCIQCVVRGTAVLWPGNWLGAVVLGTRRADPHGLFTYTQCGDCGSQRRLRSHTNRQRLVAAAPRGRGTPGAHGGENRNQDKKKGGNSARELTWVV